MKEKSLLLAAGQDEVPLRLVRGLAFAAAAAALAFGAALGMRTIVTPDLGYHLAYGDYFLETGRVVDFDLAVYPTVSSAAATGELGPGCWYDSAGRYRFPNANWLTQVIMSATTRAAGFGAISVLLALQVAGIFAFLAAAMRRLGLGWLAVAAGLAIIAVTSYERFDPRPEVMGYLILAAQFFVLCGLTGDNRPVGGAAPAAGGALRRFGPFAALVILQVLLVNVHSYFLLGLGLTGAVLGDRLLRWGWARCRRRRADAAPLAAAARWTALLLAAQMAACFVNPWTWRLAALPVQTLLFIRDNNIAQGTTQGAGHPWSMIGEFFRPFAIGVFRECKATYAFQGVLALLGAGILAAAWRRRWAHVLTIAGMIATGMEMRRNIAVCAMVATPLALASLRDVLAPLASRLLGRLQRPAAAMAGVLLTLASLYALHSVVTHSFYASERREIRFGTGLAAAAIPARQADWISFHNPAGRLWTDMACSSNLYYFTHPRREVPLLTNTWAATPKVMLHVLNLMAGRGDFNAEAAARNVGVVGLYMDGSSVELARKLAADPNWAVVQVGAPFVVFLNARRPNAALARRTALTPDTLDVKALANQLRATDPLQAAPLYLAGFTLNHIGWDTPAVALFDEALRADPHYVHRHFVWGMKGVSLARRGTLRILEDPPDLRGREDWHEARRCFIEALRARPDYQAAQMNLHQVDRQIAGERAGIRYKYPW